MTDLPILFSAPMVRAIIAGRKTQTRRVIGRLREVGAVTEFGPSTTPGYDWHFRDKDMRWHDLRHDELLGRLPHQVSGRLWVREAWRTWRDDDELSPRDLLEIWESTSDAGPPDRANVEYVADGAIIPPISIGWDPGRLRASMHLPRAYSRITLIVTDVRVQRLQDISEEDVVAEGVERLLTGRGYYDPTLSHEASRAACRFGGWYRKGVDAYAALWNHINGAGAWERNPWVAAYTFDPVLCNIDHMEAANV